MQRRSASKRKYCDLITNDTFVDLNTSPMDWQLWCRLCAKNVPEGHATQRAHTLDYIRRTMRKYFRLKITDEVKLPNILCAECFSLVKTLVGFAKHIAKVQKMYLDLQDSTDGESSISDMNAIRVKYKLQDGNKKHIIVHSQLPEVHAEETTEQEYDSTAAVVETPFESEIQLENRGDDANFEYDIDVDKCTVDDTHFNEVVVNDYEIVTIMEDPADTPDIEEMSNCSKEQPNPGKVHQLSEQECSEESSKSISCPQCPRKFKRSTNLRIHLCKTHQTKLPDRKWSCPQCAWSFNAKYKLQRHLKTHLPDEEKNTLPCQYCGKKYSTKFILQAHVQSVHMDKRPIVCEKCGISVRTNSALKSHMLTHTDYAPFECEVCGKHFKNQHRLKVHMKFHNPDKYTCEECGVQVNSSWILKKHALVHSDEMKFKCDFCERRFKRQKTLRNHLILHTDLQPYTCNFCDRTFANGSNCRSHKKREHPKELAEYEAAGIQTYTYNIPKLEQLIIMAKAAAENGTRNKNGSESESNLSYGMDCEESSSELNVSTHDEVVM